MEVFRPTWSSIRSHLRPLSIRRGPCPIEENRSVSDSVQMDPSLSSRGVGMSTSSTPVNSPDREAHIPSPETEPVRPKAKEWRPEDAKKKTTCPGGNTALHAGHHRPTIPMGTSTADILRQILARLLRHRSTLVYP